MSNDKQFVGWSGTWKGHDLEAGDRTELCGQTSLNGHRV